MSNFAALKKKTKANFSTLQKKIEAEAAPNSYADDRFWTFKASPEGNAQVTLRFLPLWDGADESSDTPIVKVMSHGVKGKTGQWYIEECPSALNGGKIVPGECPACDANNVYADSKGGWANMSDQDRNVLRSGGEEGQGRRTQYVANIFVVNDPAQPENNGTVRLWKFGPRIKSLIDGAIFPEFDDQKPLDPFDLFNGANFKLRVKKVAGQTNYDSSSFDKPSQLLADEGELEKAWLKEYNLFEFINPENTSRYKPLADLQKRWNIMKDIKAPVSEIIPEKIVPVADAGTSVEADDSFFDDLLEE